MRIGVDLSLACEKSPRGIGVYEKNIGTPSNDFCLNHKVFVFGVGRKPGWLTNDAVYINVIFRNVIIREQLILPVLCLFLGLKSIHLFANVVPLLLSINPFCRVFLTIHDVSYKYSRSYMANNKKQNTFRRMAGLAYRSWMLRYSFWRSQRVFSVSDWAAQEIKKFVRNVHNKEITVIPNVVSQVFHSKSKKNWNHRTEGMVLVVAGSHPQKNLLFLLENMLSICSLEAYCGRVRLELVGLSENEVPVKYQHVDSFNFHGMLTQEKLLSLYDKSVALIMPSYHESFSIPLIEARERGLWILSSSGGATREIAPEYTVFFDPVSSVDFVKKFDEVWSKLEQPPFTQFESPSERPNVRRLYWSSCYKENEKYENLK